MEKAEGAGVNEDAVRGVLPGVGAARLGNGAGVGVGGWEGMGCEWLGDDW